MKKILLCVYLLVVDIFSGAVSNIASLIEKQDMKYLIFGNFYLLTYDKTIVVLGFN